MIVYRLLVTPTDNQRLNKVVGTPSLITCAAYATTAISGLRNFDGVPTSAKVLELLQFASIKAEKSFTDEWLRCLTENPFVRNEQKIVGGQRTEVEK